MNTGQTNFVNLLDKLLLEQKYPIELSYKFLYISKSIQQNKHFKCDICKINGIIPCKHFTIKENGLYILTKEAELINKLVGEKKE